jgi:hypothetical protein
MSMLFEARFHTSVNEIARVSFGFVLRCDSNEGKMINFVRESLLTFKISADTT